MEIHSENKQGTAANYKHGFGFHPMLCFADATGEALAALLRPGNATANGVADHLAVLDAALAQLPAAIADRHRVGDDRAAVGRAVMVRTDSAGASHGFVGGCRERNVGFAVVARKTPSIQAAISAVCDDEAGWVAAIGQDGDEPAGSSVRELTDRADLSAWPQGMRLIVRREPRHPGAQTSLFPNLDFASGAIAPTKPASRPAWMLTCAPTPTSRTSRPPEGLWTAALPLRRPRRQPGPGSPWCASPPISCAGSSCYASTVNSR